MIPQLSSIKSLKTKSLKTKISNTLGLKQILFFVLLALMGLPQPSPAQETANLPISLDSQTWHYRLGFEKHWTHRSPDSLQYWNKQKLPLRFSDLHHGSEDQVAYTFITFFELPSLDFYQTKSLGLQLPLIGDNWQIFLNGTLIRQEMFLDSQGQIQQIRKRRKEVIALPSALLQRGENQLTFHILGNPRDHTVGIYSPAGNIIDNYHTLLKQNSETVTFVLIFLYLFTGLYHLLLFSKRPQDRYNLFFSLFAIILFVYIFARSAAAYTLIPHTPIASRIEYISLFSLFPLFLFFLEEYFFKKISQISKVFLYWCIILSVLVIFFPMTWNYNILFIWQLSGLAMIGYSLMLFYRALHHGKKGAPTLLAGYVLFIITAAFDIIDAVWLNYNLLLSRYTFFVFIMGIAVLLARRFLQVHNQVEELNSTLEQKVEQRTQKLQDTLQRVQNLKVQQDGDYFLTSLLIQPLGKISSSHDPISIQEWTEQKKQFKFHHKQAEIGGDINISNQIKLQQKDYVVFVNADAMGKSIQGAGGALVLGVVFNSFVTRTQLASMYQNKSPEEWLHECYTDLQSVFEAFDGSMLASMVMGLVDKDSGSLYYINAEHPWSVLYRNGKAQFLEDDLTLRKVGIALQPEPFRIRTLSLHQGDVLFFGSDGRDDLIIGTDAEGNRIINEDEELFLKHVQSASGDLEGIVQAIKDTGDLSDDLTLMRLKFHGQGLIQPHDEASPETDKAKQEARRYLTEGEIEKARLILLDFLARTEKTKTADRFVAHEELMRLYFKDKNYREAARQGESALGLFPLDNHLLFLTSYAQKKSRQYALACFNGERLRLREPDNIKNIINLADNYRNRKLHDRSFELTEKALALDPDNKEAGKLKAALEQLAGQVNGLDSGI